MLSIIRSTRRVCFFWVGLCLIATLSMSNLHANAESSDGLGSTENILAEPPMLGPEKPPFEVLGPRERVSLEVNIPATRVDLYVEGQFHSSYPIAIGQSRYPTPTRELSITRIEWNPYWYPPKSDWAKDAKVTPPGPGNPLGVVKLVMEDGYLFHGTNKPWSVGRAASHGCMRMHKKDVTNLAWEIQKRYTENVDPALLEKYKKRRRRTFVVKLVEPIPVKTVYKQVERKGDRLLLHPNRYWKKGFQDQLETALLDIDDILVDKKLAKKLNRMRRRKTVEVSLAEIRQMATPRPQPSSFSAENTLPKGAAAAAIPQN